MNQKYFRPQPTTESYKAILNRKNSGKSLKRNHVQWFFFLPRCIRKSSGFYEFPVFRGIPAMQICTNAILF